MGHHHDTDRRVRKTRTQLHDALASLVHEKPYDDIVVKEILARADVGRSTFYAHYRDKDELLERGIRDMLCIDSAQSSARGTSPCDRLLGFSLPFLEHVEQFRVGGELPLDAIRVRNWRASTSTGRRCRPSVRHIRRPDQPPRQTRRRELRADPRLVAGASHALGA